MYRRIFSHLFVFTLIFAFMFTACEQQINGPESLENHSDFAALSTDSDSEDEVSLDESPLSVTETFLLEKGVKMKLQWHVGKAEIKIKDKSREDEEVTLKFEKMAGEGNHIYNLSSDNGVISIEDGIEVKIQFMTNGLPAGLEKSDKIRLFQEIVGDDGETIITRDFTEKCKVGSGKNAKVQIQGTLPQTGEFFIGFKYDSDDKIYRLTAEIAAVQTRLFKTDKTKSMSLGGGSKVTVPAGALSEDTEISMFVTLEEIDGIGTVKHFWFEPHGLAFNQPIQIVLKYKELGWDEADLLYFNEKYESWEDSESCTINDQDVIRHNKEAKYFVLDVHHFSRYAVAYGR